MHQPPRMDPVEPPGWRLEGWAWVTGSRTLLHRGFLLRRLSSWDCRSSQEMKHFFPPSLRFTDLIPSINVHTHTPVWCGPRMEGSPQAREEQGCPPRSGAVRIWVWGSRVESATHRWPGLSQPFATLSRHVSPAGQWAQVPSVPPHTVKGNTKLSLCRMLQR